MPTARMITKEKKIHRQERAPTRKPAKVGPMAGANMMTRAVTPMAAPSLWGGMTSMTMANIIGRMRPVPIPWMARPVKARGKEGAKPEMRAPRRKAPKATRVRLLVLNHFMRMLEKGRTMPMTSI